MSGMEPASSIVSKFGGPSKLAKILAVHRTRVSNWTRPKEAGGSGGRIPQAHHRTILSIARERELDIAAEDLLPSVENTPTDPARPAPEPAGATV